MSFVSEHLGLPGLRGYWPTSAFDSSGNVFDMSGQNRTLTYNGNPLHNVVSTYNAPYLDLDGTGDYLSRSDEAGLDILGTETFITTGLRGLTLGLWCYADSTSGVRFLCAKDTGTSRSWLFYLDGGVPTAYVFDTDSTFNTIAGSTVSTSTWTHMVLRFVPSTRISIFKNGSEVVSSTTSIKASIRNSTAPIEWGAQIAAQFFDGRISNMFLCGMYLADGQILDLYNNTKAYYGL